MKRIPVRLMRRAMTDLERILDWIKEQSPQGAIRWLEAMERGIDRVSRFPNSISIAPEAEQFGIKLRQVFFKTAKGRTYRLVVRIEEEGAYILRVLRPGHPPLRAEDVAE